MDGKMAERFQEHFGKMTDSRVERTKLYPLEEILFVLLCCCAAVLLDLRVSAALEPEKFRACFLAWAASLQRVPGEVIAIDGKTLRNSAGVGTPAIHMVSAFATDSRLVLALAKK